MPNYAVSASAKDGTNGSGANTNGTSLVASYNYTTGDPTGAPSDGFALIDTSAIGTDTITAATLYWYHTGYTKTKTNAYSRRIRVGGTAILDTSATPAAAGWHSEALTSGELSLINKTGETGIGFEMNDPGTGFNAWTIQSWDYGDHSRACYLAVTHAAAGGPTKFSVLR